MLWMLCGIRRTPMPEVRGPIGKGSMGLNVWRSSPQRSARDNFRALEFPTGSAHGRRRSGGWAIWLSIVLVLLVRLALAPPAAFAQSVLAPEITSVGPFTVDEGTTTVASLTATDGDTIADDLEWSKTGGADADEFTLNSTGVLALVAAKDFENLDDADSDGTYEVQVQVSDGSNTDTADLVVTIENVIELSSAITGPSAVTFAENSVARLATYAASSDDDRDGIEWVLSGTDGDLFSIDSPRGALRFDIDPVAPKLFTEPPDFEGPIDSDTGNDYELTLQARVGTQASASFDVTVTVTDEDEAGSLSLSSKLPQAGSALTATLSDPDGVTAGTTTWKWERSTGRNRWAVINGATSATYPPAAADTNAFLRVTATYDDEHGASKTVDEVVPNVVTGPLLTGLSATTGDSTANTSRALFPTVSPETLHYGIGCANNDTMTLTPSAPASARLAVNGTQVAGGTAVEVPVTPFSDVSISVTTADGANTVYVVHCQPEVLFDLETAKTAGATGVFEDLLGFDHRNHIVVMDHNGVPRLRWTVPRGDGLATVGDFRFHRVGDNGDYRYSYRRPASNSQNGSMWTVLDEDLQPISESVRTVSPIVHTDSHGFRVLPNGNYLLMAYEPATRDLTKLSFMDPSRTMVPVWDSVIQIVTPTGQALFTWNSWDHMALEDCTQHRFPAFGPGRPPPDRDIPGYAHINSFELVDGRIVGSFRGCSKVLAIDADSGKVVWRLGRSNLTDDQWAARGIGPAPLTIVNDPLGEFCAQHSAQILPNGNLLLFDNGVKCVVNPWTLDQLGRAGDDYSRAVEYELDFDNNEAVYVREHSIHGQKDTVAFSAGQVELLDNGDWLVSWGRPPAGGPHASPLDVNVTQVDPSTGQEKFHVGATDAYKTLEPRAKISAVAVPAEALAPKSVPLAANLPASSYTSVFHQGADASPQVVVAFNRPVGDFDETSPSLSVTGATVLTVSPHVVADETANAYLVTLTPEGDGPVTFALVANQACPSGGICAADGTTLSEVPSQLVVGDPPTVRFEQATYRVGEGNVLSVGIRLGAAHQGVRGVTVPVVVTGGSASSEDFTAAESVVFDAGETYRVVTVETMHDDLVEGPEMLTLGFGALPEGMTAGSVAGSEITITDADQPPGASNIFEDIGAGVWYESAVTWMIENNITQGCTPTMFCPDQNLTRQQFVTFLWRAAGQPIPKYTGSQAFADVEDGVYSDQAIGWALANDITRGCTAGTFGDGSWQFCPEQHVTRGEMATLLYRHVEATYVGQPPHHTDVEPDALYTTSITWLTDFVVVPGCDLRLWCPNRAATRAEAALFINGVALRPHIWGAGNTSFTPQPQ